MLYKLLFLLYILVGQWLLWLVIWLGGRIGIWRVLFVIHPHNSKEYQYVAPDWRWLRKYLSGRPLPIGLIWYGYRPIGIYFIISNTIESLRKRKNRHIAKRIERRMQRALRLTRARSCGFAGHLGIIFEKRHDIPMQPPFYGSTNGNIYSLLSTIAKAKKETEKHEDRNS